MSTNLSTTTLEELVSELPRSLRVEVRNFVEFLLSKRRPATKRVLRQDWANALSTHGYSSVELQHLATDWRVDSVST